MDVIDWNAWQAALAPRPWATNDDEAGFGRGCRGLRVVTAHR
jgi:hypothetical protein